MDWRISTNTEIGSQKYEKLAMAWLAAPPDLSYQSEPNTKNLFRQL